MFRSLLASGSCLAAANELNFLVMGDWGGTGHEPWTHNSQLNTAKSMDRAAAQLGADFTLALGDNFYSTGVSSVDDPRFNLTFENVFTGDSLSEQSGHKFHVIAGNHDHYGDAQAQVQYSQRSKRWNFPSLWYTFSKTAPDGATVQFVMIDTIEIAGQSIVGHPDEGVSLKGSQMPGPANVAAAESQIQWIDKTLASSTADYVVVSGHYPVHSAAEHGPTKQLKPSAFPFLQRHGVSAYLCGHDHVETHFDMGDGVQYHVIGSANYQGSWDHIDQYTDEQIKFKAVTYGGYATISVSMEGMYINHFDGYGALQYAAPAIMPRGAPPSPTPPVPPMPTTTAPPPGACADEDSWPDRDHGLVCGECKVLVNKFDSKYSTCNGYCESIGRSCTGAWEEMSDTCEVKFGMACSEPLDNSDALCQCSGDTGSGSLV